MHPLLFNALSALVLGCFATGVAAQEAAPDAAAPDVPEAACELHVWPAAGLSLTRQRAHDNCEPSVPDPVRAMEASQLEGAVRVLEAFTPLKVITNEEISSQTHQVGDNFSVTVLEDVIENGTVVIPAGSTGHGKVTFATARGGFGKPGLVAISLQSLQLGNSEIELDGRYREEGRGKNGTVAATWFAVGIFSGFIKGRAGVIEKGRELKARTGEPISYTVGLHATPIAADQETAITCGENAATPCEPTPEVERDSSSGGGAPLAETVQPNTYQEE